MGGPARNQLLLVSLGLLALGAAAVTWRTVNPPPPPQLGDVPVSNVVFIVMDTQRADALGTYGYPKDTSPNVDRFAQGAVVFDNAYSPGSYTVPSFLSYMSSVAVRTHGWDYPFDVRFPKPGFCARADLTTLAEVLQESGFDNRTFVSNGLLHPKRGFPRGFETWNTFNVQGLASRELTKAQARFRDREVVAKGIESIESWEPGEHHFLYLHLMYPHLPHEPSRAVRKELDLPDEPKRFSTTDVKKLRETSTQEERDLTRLFYHAGVWDGDVQIGRILDAIDDAGHHNDTMVVFMSDHGEEIWEHGDYGHVDGVWEQLAHVPLMVRIPGVRPRRIRYPVSLIDVAPTVLDAMGIADVPDTWQGTNLFEKERVGVVTKRLGESAITIDGRFRAVHDDMNNWSLYDLQTDPNEQSPITDGPRLDKLKERYADFTALAPAGEIDRGAPVTGICGVLGGQEEADHLRELKALGYVQ